MTTFEQAFQFWWGHHSIRALFHHSEGVGRIVYADIWNTAIDEAAAVALDTDVAVSKNILELKYGT